MSRTAFPDMVDALADNLFDDVTIDGELLVVRDGMVQPFSVLQQRLNRKTVSAKLIADIRCMSGLTICWQTTAKTCGPCHSIRAGSAWRH